jgi:hypothetical protein
MNANLAPNNIYANLKNSIVSSLDRLNTFKQSNSMSYYGNNDNDNDVNNNKSR